MSTPVHELTKQQSILVNSTTTSKFNRMARVRLTNRLFKGYFLFSILALCFVLALVIIFIGKTGFLTFNTLSFSEFFLSMNWAPEEDHFGAGLFIINTMILTGLTLLISVPISIAIAVFNAEIAPNWFKSFIRPVLDLLVGIPSIVYGYLGMTVLIPFIRDLTGESLGDGMLAAALVLSLMILPTISRISDDAITAVPKKYREAAYALGSTRLQVIFKIVIPAASRGIVTAIILGMTRAIGETMAVVMVIGNTAQLATTLFTPSSVLTSNIVMQISNVEFDSTWNYALHMMAFLLLAISVLLILIIRFLRAKGVKEA
ncbi:phosphate ABC transporter permease subunit PstC [Paenibacillus selenitireducens]|uniref:Phosphate transport system permease protein n=1 Tax=Paenibacillus selenitireducens TaxID=1324314 RepID=A0A1T2XM22_9BACL|nr:phosphate ABC transporter permease subunit PstC [Paenibacillus selenitireducens]OPA80924.1 phosphate ABC transporter permease subunit PstC [Paenibacillus selenitireducens]